MNTEDNKIVIEFIKNQNIEINDKNTILKEVDKNCEITSVSLNGTSIMMGNFWDFHPDCHGFDLPHFSSVSELILLIHRAIRSIDKEVEILIDNDWIYED